MHAEEPILDDPRDEAPDECLSCGEADPRECICARAVGHSDNRDSWLARRMQYVTASDAAALLDESKWRTRDELRREKAGIGEVVEETERMWFGRELEERVLELLPACPHSPTYGMDIRPCGLLIPDADADSRLAATPDAWLFSDEHGRIPLQLKISGWPWRETKANGGDVVPLDYQLQIQCEAACADAPAAAIVQVHANYVSHFSIVPRHEGVIARLRQESARLMSEAEALRSGKLEVG